MYRIHLTEDERAELQRRTRVPGVMPRTRDRLEMVRLCAAGWKPAEIGGHLDVSVRRVRHWLKQYLKGGFDALPDQPHVGQTSRLTPELLDRIRALFAQGDRTWTTRQVAEWLEAEHGLRFSHDHLGMLLRRARLSCRRTERDLKHKQDPEQVAVCTGELAELEKGALPGAWTCAT